MGENIKALFFLIKVSCNRVVVVVGYGKAVFFQNFNSLRQCFCRRCAEWFAWLCRLFFAWNPDQAFQILDHLGFVVFNICS